MKNDVKNKDQFDITKMEMVGITQINNPFWNVVSEEYRENCKNNHTVIPELNCLLCETTTELGRLMLKYRDVIIYEKIY